MTENVCESHVPLQRKVTLIKPHLMIALIKSATLFLSLRVRLYEREGGLEQSLCTVNVSLEMVGGAFPGGSWP